MYVRKANEKYLLHVFCRNRHVHHVLNVLILIIFKGGRHPSPLSNYIHLLGINCVANTCSVLYSLVFRMVLTLGITSFHLLIYIKVRVKCKRGT